MSWVSGADFATATADPVAVAGNGPSATKHCNEHHADDVLLMARAFSGLGAEIKAASVLSIDMSASHLRTLFRVLFLCMQ
jgi:hypothetical protein